MKGKKPSIAGRKQLGLPARVPDLDSTAPETRPTDLDATLCDGAGIRYGGQTTSILVEPGEFGTHGGGWLTKREDLGDGGEDGSRAHELSHPVIVAVGARTAIGTI